MLKNVLSIVIALVLIALGYVQLNGSESDNNNDPNQKTKSVGGSQPATGQKGKSGPNLAGNTLKPDSKSAKQPAPGTGSKTPAAKTPPAKTPAKTPSKKAPAKKAPAKKAPTKKAPKAASNRIVVTLRGGHKEDITETLARIKRGEKHSHRNDGSVFGNYERRLPRKQRGYYREYVHPTPGVRHAGPRRVVMGKRGEVYYTHDHYKTFTKVQVTR